MVATRIQRLRMAFEADRWESGDTATLVCVVFEWAQAGGLGETTNKEALYAVCHEVWPNQLYEDMWITKTGHEISRKIGRLRIHYDQVGRLIDLSGGGIDIRTGKITTPPNWKMANEPLAFVYLRSVGLKDYDRLDYIFGDMKLALFPFEEAGEEDNLIVVD